MKFITLTNNGYLDYTRNLIESLRRIDIKQPSECGEAGCVLEPLKVYCIGQECYDNLDYNNKELLEAEGAEEFQQFREGDWNKVVVQKFNIIHNDNSELCSGIIYAKCNDKNKTLFNPENIDMNHFECDQIHFNKIKAKLHYDKLPLKKYPNGRFYYTMKPERPYCIHFNYVVGHMKKEFMKQYDYWLI